MNVLLICSAGMSTSLLVNKMNQACEKKGYTWDILAISGSELGDHLEKADVVLLAPQVRYMLDKMKALTSSKGIPVGLIDMQHYGLLNGEAVVEQIVQMKNQ